LSVAAVAPDHAGAAEVVAEVPGDGVGDIRAADALAAEEEIVVAHVVAEVGFHDGVAAGAVPVEGAAGSLDAAAVGDLAIRAHWLTLNPHPLKTKPKGCGTREGFWNLRMCHPPVPTFIKEFVWYLTSTGINSSSFEFFEPFVPQTAGKLGTRPWTVQEQYRA